MRATTMIRGNSSRVGRMLLIMLALSTWKAHQVSGQRNSASQQSERSGAQVLSPKNFNLAEGKRIEATATCGEFGREFFCKLIGAYHLERNQNYYGHGEFRRGQDCDNCEPHTTPDKPNDKSHPAAYAIDGTERWWQSPPLSRNKSYSDVNVTIDLGQEFHVAYIIIKMANSPRPAVWVLERSKDNGKTFTPWQYFADDSTHCIHFFGREVISMDRLRDDSVVCETKFSKINPPDGGEIVVSLINGRPSAENFSSSETLHEWTKATHVRLHLIRPITTMGHYLMDVDDETVTRRYFYSIKDITIGGRCVCNGHADECTTRPDDPSGKHVCRCQHNTCGDQCDHCCGGYSQKKWKAASVEAENQCEPCNCFGHSLECHYNETVEELGLSLDIHGNNEGGGVCDNCQHNTEGINCNKCKYGYYRPENRPLTASNVCQRCNCFGQAFSGACDEGTGRCQCKKNYAGTGCDECADGFYGYPVCRECDCFQRGTIGNVCQLENEVQCNCKPQYSGEFCRECAPGHFGFPNCTKCDCPPNLVNNMACNADSGACSCKPEFVGRNCNECAPGFYQHPFCFPCACNNTGVNVTAGICDAQKGQCICKEGYMGTACSQCAPGYFGYPNCRPCACVEGHSKSYTCDSITGKCQCEANYAGDKCNECAPEHWNYPQCTECACDYTQRGVTCNQGDGSCKCKRGYWGFPNCRQCSCPDSATCDPVDGQCTCPPLTEGKFCENCTLNAWDFNQKDGCKNCSCNSRGVVYRNLACDLTTGQCNCRTNIEGRQCDRCVRGHYGFPNCNLCECDLRGVTPEICDRTTSRCSCKENVWDTDCSQCRPDSFNLQEDNPAGCTKCFCFGVVNQCRQSLGRVVQQFDMDNPEWKSARVTGLLGTSAVLDLNFDDLASQYDSSDGTLRISPIRPVDVAMDNIYAVAPKSYLGKRIGSYGLKLSFTVAADLGGARAIAIDRSPSSSASDIQPVFEPVVQPLTGPDVVIVTRDAILIHEHSELPPDTSAFTFDVILNERQFRNLKSGSQPSREQFMTALLDVRGIYLRVSHFSGAQQLILSRVLLDFVSNNRFIADAPQAMSVEECACSRAYQGLSCEECAPGHYRNATVPYLGTCAPCNCNGHTNKCNPQTGECIDCGHNTMGPDCGKCKPGFVGNATTGTPNDCLHCPCPLPIQSNSFASQCEMVPSRNYPGRQEIKCTCKEGYTGQGCEQCAPGYFGDPLKIGDTCKPCDCNGNINKTEPGSCDARTGECLKCLDNTDGTRCEHCKDGFFGDAIVAKNCRPCKCDREGTQYCNRSTGDCICRDTIVGILCDECPPAHYGIKSMRRCVPCNCGNASISTECDMTSGQCRCNPGVGGLHCKTCQPGYWNYSPAGCEWCNCNKNFSTGDVCDINTGKCNCLPGVVGRACDGCPKRWALISASAASSATNVIIVFWTKQICSTRQSHLSRRSWLTHPLPCSPSDDSTTSMRMLPAWVND